MVPFLKWAGGKRWLFTPEFVKGLPKFERYIEPFLGGGAGFFALEPTHAILSDVNPALIQLYEVVRDHPVGLKREILKHHKAHCKEYYYKVRSTTSGTKIQKAARTLYLNRTCWNGLYRLNLKGEFNVPIGTKNAVFLDTDDFSHASRILSNATISCSDFEDCIDLAQQNDLIFVDPPYTVKHNMNGFVKYNESIFSWDDQIRLRDALVRANNRGAHIVATNADHSSVQDLYVGSFQYTEIARRSIISGQTKGRGITTEAVFKSFGS